MQSDAIQSLYTADESESDGEGDIYLSGIKVDGAATVPIPEGSG